MRKRPSRQRPASAGGQRMGPRSSSGRGRSTSDPRPPMQRREGRLGAVRLVRLRRLPLCRPVGEGDPRGQPRSPLAPEEGLGGGSGAAMPMGAGLPVTKPRTTSSSARVPTSSSSSSSESSYSSSSSSPGASAATAIGAAAAGATAARDDFQERELARVVDDGAESVSADCIKWGRGGRKTSSTRRPSYRKSVQHC